MAISVFVKVELHNISLIIVGDLFNLFPQGLHSYVAHRYKHLFCLDLVRACNDGCGNRQSILVTLDHTKFKWDHLSTTNI